MICFGNSCAVFEQFRNLKLGIDVPEAEHRSKREALQERDARPEGHTGRLPTKGQAQGVPVLPTAS